MIGQFQFAELQGISYSITREKAPVYTMGSPDVRAYSRNKRGIAGSLIWINFDRHALLNVFRRGPQHRDSGTSYFGCRLGLSVLSNPTPSRAPASPGPAAVPNTFPSSSAG